MGNNAVSPYQQVIEKTKSLSFRSQMLAMNIEKKLNQSGRSEVGISYIFLNFCYLFCEIYLNIILNLFVIIWFSTSFKWSSSPKKG